MIECTYCGVAVANVEQHQRWHQDQATIIEAAQTAVIRISGLHEATGGLAEDLLALVRQVEGIAHAVRRLQSGR